MKTCTECRTEKPLSEFWPDRSKKHGYMAKCKKCRAVISNRYRKEKRYDKKRYWENPQAERERHIIRKYNISQNDYEAILQKQKGVCAICKRKQDKVLDIDHCHETGVVRGLLCSNCNRMLGYAKDSQSTLLSAIDYLESSLKSRRSS